MLYYITITRYTQNLLFIIIGWNGANCLESRCTCRRLLLRFFRLFFSPRFASLIVSIFVVARLPQFFLFVRVYFFFFFFLFNTRIHVYFVVSHQIYKLAECSGCWSKRKSATDDRVRILKLRRKIFSSILPSSFYDFSSSFSSNIFFNANT